MLISVGILWKFKNDVEQRGAKRVEEMTPNEAADVAATTVDAPPHNVSRQRAMDAVPESKRILALIVIFIIVIVFWMAFHQNGSTLTYWADDNTAWSVSVTISNAINPFWIIFLTFPLVWFWKWLDQKGMEPSTPTKMALGMLLTALSFYILFCAAKTGESYVPAASDYPTGTYRITDRAIGFLKADGVPDDVLAKLEHPDIEGKKFATDEKGTGESHFNAALETSLGPQAAQYRPALLRRAFIFKVSPLWLILSYMVISLGELMLSPMGLSLVSKVAPIRMRGMMMGGWFVATALGNKLTMIGVFWERWMQSSFFVILGTMALIMAFVLLLLLRPLKKAMPGV